jgi:hypothetical protein
MDTMLEKGQKYREVYGCLRGEHSLGHHNKAGKAGHGMGLFSRDIR